MPSINAMYRNSVMLHNTMKTSDVSKPISGDDSTLLTLSGSISVEEQLHATEKFNKKKLTPQQAGLYALFQMPIPALPDALNQLGKEFSDVVGKLSNASRETNANFAIPGAPGRQEPELEKTNHELTTLFTKFGEAASVLREVLSSTTLAIEEAVRALVEMMSALNTLHAELNKLARDKVEKSAIQAFNTAMVSAVLSVVKEGAACGMVSVKTTKNIAQTEKLHKEKLAHLTEADKLQLHGKAPKFDVDGKGEHNRTASDYLSAKHRNTAEEIQHNTQVLDAKYNRDIAQVQAGKMAAEGVVKLIEAEGNKESKLTDNEAKNAEFQAAVAQRTLEDLKNTMQKSMQYIFDLIQQMRTSQQNLMQK